MRISVIRSSLLACVCLAACDPSEPPVLRFIEPMNTATIPPDSHLWLVAQGANQAADGARLATLAANVTDVRYSILDRHSAFLLRGDLAEGLPGAGDPLEGLQLPALAAGTIERTEDVMALSPDKWSSLRVYDRGLCSDLQRWQSVSQRFAQGFAQQIEDQDGIRGVELRGGGLTPILRADFPTNDVTLPRDIDGLKIHYDFHADAMHIAGHPALGCRPVNADLDIELWLESTDRAYLEIDAAVFALGCYLGAELETYRSEHEGDLGCHNLPPPVSDGRWLDPAQADHFITQIRYCDSVAACSTDSSSSCAFTPVAARMDLLGRSIRNDLEAGRALTCDADAQLGFVFGDGGTDWRVEQRYPYSGLKRKNDKTLLLSFSRFQGHALGAHDVLAHIMEARLGNFPSRHCTERTANHRIPQAFHQKLSRSLVLGFGAAIRAGARLSESDRENIFILREDRACQQDTDCDFRAAVGPAFQGVPVAGETTTDHWRGGRHMCRYEDPSICAGHCAFQLEPDHLNFRPDGLEVVLDWDFDIAAPDSDENFAASSRRDPQAEVYEFIHFARVDPDTRDPLQCNPGRTGFLPAVDSNGDLTEPLDTPLPVPFAITPVVASDPVACIPPVTDAP